MELINLFICALSGITLLYSYFKYKYSYFRAKNISYIEPTFPMGNANVHFFTKLGQELETIHKIFKERGVKYGGIYLLTKPVLIIIDPDIIKAILTKDFNHFNDRGIHYSEEKEFICAHLFALKASKWKALRKKISPIFTSSKLKYMMPTFTEKTSNLEEKLHELADTAECFDVKDFSLRVTTDMFCSVCFGVDCNSFKDPDTAFFKCAETFITNNLTETIILILPVILPKLFDKLNLKQCKKEVADFFIPAITEIVEFREKNGIERLDFMNLLIKLKNNVNIEDDKKNVGRITLKELIAQCLIFFVGGFDTSATVMCYVIFELSQQENLQNKLREEIHTVLKKYDGQITYEAIQDMQYLDKVVSESMRKYPPGCIISRKCVKDYIMPDTNTKIDKDTAVMISVLGLHHDPEYYPDPEKFDPERFSEEEKAKRPAYAYLPFGEGPRNCIGLRLGQIQSKIGVIHFIKNFKYKLNPKTRFPLQFKTNGVLLGTESKIWLDVKRA